MDPIQIINSFLPFLVSFSPVVGKLVVGGLTLVVALPAGLSAAVTSAVAIWHGVIALFTGLAAIPGLQGLSKVVAKMQADTAAIESGEGKLLSGLDRLSGIKLPQPLPATTPASGAQPVQG